MGMDGQRHAPSPLSTAMRPGTHCIGGWVRPRADLDGCDLCNAVVEIKRQLSLFFVHILNLVLKALHVKKNTAVLIRLNADL
jgi:hypothetical protein